MKLANKTKAIQTTIKRHNYGFLMLPKSGKSVQSIYLEKQKMNIKNSFTWKATWYNILKNAHKIWQLNNF